jgi:1A family penicillin-binding protein
VRSSVHSKEEIEAYRHFYHQRKKKEGGPERPGHPSSKAKEHKRIGRGILPKVLLALSVLFVLVLLGGVGGGFAVYAYYSQDLPSVDQIGGNTFETTKIYDRNGNLLTEVYDADQGKRTYVSLQEISPWVVAATIATEDANFYSNSGVDLRALVRAVYIEATGKGSSGASTITQQLVRNVILTRYKYDRTVSRKIREGILAVKFSQTYSKDKILEMYLNEIPYGNQAYGIEAASQTYFGKLSKDLDLAQSSLLAGLPQAPSVYNPLQNLEGAKKRQAIVLGLMVKQGLITQDQATQAAAEELDFVQQRSDLKAPHFVSYVRQVLEATYGPEVVDRGGLTVYTTIDLNYQALAEQVVKDQVNQLKDFNAHNGALVAMKPGTGEILAMVGSADYNDDNIDGQINMATWERQPGSAIKPITYLAAFKKGWNPATVIPDVKTEFDMGPGADPYAPKNYDGTFHGPVSVRTALANSLNIPAVKTLQFAGLQNTIDMAHDLGVTGLQKGLENYGLSLTLGGGEVSLLDLTTAYSTMANEGKLTGAVGILKVIDKDGNTIYEYNPDESTQDVIDSKLVYEITSVLSDNKAREMAFGPDNPLKLDRPAAAKTGTTDDWKDNWTVGYTPGLVVGVWVGNTDDQAMQHSSGITGAAPIWHDYMESVYKDQALTDVLKDPDGNAPPTDFRQPAGMVQVEVCPDSGLLPSPACPKKVKEWFLPSQVPTKHCEWHKTVKICKTSNKLATEWCPADQVESKAFLTLPKEYAGWSSADKTAPTDKCDKHFAPGAVPITDTTSLTPAPSADFPNLRLVITSPSRNQPVNGVVAVEGSALIDQDAFQYFTVEVGSGANPGNWVSLGGKHTTPVNTGLLGSWDTAGVADGLYTIRLTIVNKKNESLAVTVRVQIGSISVQTPVPTPSASPEPTQPPPAQATEPPPATPSPGPGG